MPEVFYTARGLRVLVTPAADHRRRFNLEWIDERDEVVRKRESVPAATVEDLKRLEGWVKG